MSIFACDKIEVLTVVLQSLRKKNFCLIVNNYLWGVIKKYQDGIYLSKNLILTNLQFFLF